MDRRNFVTGAIMAMGASLTPGTLSAAAGKKPLLTFGICSDIHLDLMPDGQRRLQAFLNAMGALQPDFIIQLGDFCSPHAKNKIYADAFNGFSAPAFHVIGNHDTDYGFTHQQVVDFLRMPAPYYSFDAKGYHFVVLNGNERPEGDTSRWPSHISDPQLQWLEEDLRRTSLPVMVFTHQGFDVDVPGVIVHGSRVRVVLERANEAAGYLKVQAVFSGHRHQDYYNVINDIHYLQINSMSYYWMGSEYRRLRYSAGTDKEFPWVKDTAPYKDPIWAVVSVYRNGEYRLTGMSTDFLAPSPAEMGMPVYEKIYPVVAKISNRTFRIKK